GGGKQICWLYDVKRAKFGQAQYLVTAADKFGKVTRTYDGLEVSTNLRFGHGGTLFGGVSTGRSVADTCFVVDSPQALYRCHQERPWAGQTQVKMAGNYPLPGGVGLSAVFQVLPGQAVNGSWTVPNALVAPSLGRNLAACGAAGTCTATTLIGAPAQDP